MPDGTRLLVPLEKVRVAQFTDNPALLQQAQQQGGQFLSDVARFNPAEQGMREQQQQQPPKAAEPQQQEQQPSSMETDDAEGSTESEDAAGILESILTHQGRLSNQQKEALADMMVAHKQKEVEFEQKLKAAKKESASANHITENLRRQVTEAVIPMLINMAQRNGYTMTDKERKQVTQSFARVNKDFVNSVAPVLVAASASLNSPLGQEGTTAPPKAEPAWRTRLNLYRAMQHGSIPVQKQPPQQQQPQKQPQPNMQYQYQQPPQQYAPPAQQPQQLQHPYQQQLQQYTQAFQGHQAHPQPQWYTYPQQQQQQQPAPSAYAVRANTMQHTMPPPPQQHQPQQQYYQQQQVQAQPPVLDVAASSSLQQPSAGASIEDRIVEMMKKQTGDVYGSSCIDTEYVKEVTGLKRA